MKLLVVIVLLIGSICIAFGLDNRAGSTPTIVIAGDDSAAIFKSRCTKCHLTDGTGKESYTPDFTDAKWQATKKNEELISSITDGLNDMPAFGDILSKDEIKGMVSYVRSLAKSGK